MAKILVVDDDQNLTFMTKTALSQQGYDVSVCHSALGVIETIRSNKPDLVLMDIMMPGISGAQAARSLQQDPQLKRIPIVFLTGLIGNDEDDVQKTGINVDGVNYRTLGKPYEIDELIKTIETSLTKRVLIVDDDPGIIDAIERILRREGGYELSVASNGHEAELKFISSKPRLVIMDINMPGPTGLQVCAKFKNAPENKSLKVLLMSGNAGPVELTKAKESGADDFLAKPFSTAALKAKVEALLK